MIKFLKNQFTKEFKNKFINDYGEFISYFVSNNLYYLARIFNCDKGVGHFYTQHYQHHFKNKRLKKIKLLEIGVGGYENPTLGGNSLRMWKKYFPFGKIYALDIYDKSLLEESRIKIFKGSQVDEIFLMSICNEVGEFDIIIDDGSHLNEHVIKTFKILFPKLNNGGIYVVEDTQTSYWKDYGGNSDDLNDKNTMYHFFKSLIDSLNHNEFIIEGYEKNYFDTHIISMHFYHNMIFIYKGENNEPSNLVNYNRFRICEQDF